MPDTKKQRAPAGLRAAGSQLWKRFTAEYHFDERELVLLTLAARTADDIADLEGAITRDGIVVTGAAGQARMNACLPELRQARIALARHLGALGLPDENGQQVTATSSQASRAAHARWDRARRVQQGYGDAS